jgi:hypothetical protein
VDNEGIYAGGAQCENVLDHVSPAEDRMWWITLVRLRIECGGSR